MRTVVEIEREMGELEAQRTALKSKLRVLEDERNVAVAAEKLLKLPESGIAALRKALQTLDAKGIESAEKFGKVGG